MVKEIYPWQQRQWQRMADAVAADRLPHALLLGGQGGLGIDHFADCLAASWLCEQSNHEGACGRCRSCLLYHAGNHPDLARATPEEGGKQIKVEEVRGLVQFMQMKSQYGRGKIAIITPAEAMNRSAANALLKILEEPPPGCIFILVAHHPESLPVTIRSRCQKLDFAPTYDDTSRDWLAARAAIDPSRATDMLILARGRPLHALALLESDIAERQARLLAELGKLDRRAVDVTALAQHWQDSGTAEVFEWLQQFLAMMTRLKISPVAGVEPVSTLTRDLQRLANRLDLPALVRAYDLALQNYRAVTGPYNLNQTGLLEQFILFWQSAVNVEGGH